MLIPRNRWISATIIFCLTLVSPAMAVTEAAAELPADGARSPFLRAAAASLPAGEFAISERDSDEYSPAIAYNSRHDEYLVVWENVWAGGHHDIYAQRVSGGGQLLSWFAVSSNSNKQMEPSVAYDQANDRYLVVFLYDVWGDGSDWDVSGRLIPWNGPNAGLTDFVICSFTSNQGHPVTAFAWAQQEFLVAWVNFPSGQPSYVSARRVFADGSGMPAGPFVVSSGTESRDFTDVAYNLARNEYLVTWDVVKSGTGVDIYGIRLTATGTALTGGNSNVTGEFPIADWPAVEEKPAVSSCGDQFLVAWQSDQDTGGTDYAIYGRYLTGEGVPGNVYEIVDTTLPQVNVDIACDANLRKYLLLWQDRYVGGEYGIWARFAYPSEFLDPDFEVVGPRSAADREYPAIAGGRTAFLTAWEHDRDGGTNLDIHGRLVPIPTLFNPLVPCRVLDTRVTSGPTAAAPALASMSLRTFAVAGTCGVPTDAAAFSANLTAVGGTAIGDLRVIGGHLTSTITSALSIPLSRARANNAIVQLSTHGDGTISVINSTGGTVHFILDVNGYFR